MSKSVGDVRLTGSRKLAKVIRAVMQPVSNGVSSGTPERPRARTHMGEQLATT
jgi:hypothetical protein